MEPEKQHAIDLSLDLTIEELFVLTQMVQIPQLLGIDFEELQALPANVQTAVSATATRGLQARQFIHKNEQGKWEPTPFVTSLMLVCAVPQKSFILLQQRPDMPPAPHFAHTVADDTVIMYPLSLGLYRFILSQQENPQLQMANSVLALADKPTVAIRPFTITQENVNEAQTLASQNQQTDAVQALTKAGVKPTAAAAFVAAMANMEAITTITHIVHARDGQPQTSAGFTLLDSKQGFWRLQPEDEAIVISPVSQSDVAANLSALFNGEQ